MLYPQNNQCRTVQSLNGIWKYSLVSDAYRAETPLAGADLMAVPASINEIVTDAIPRDYVGRVAFETEVEASVADGAQKLLYIGSAGHKFEVYVNGQKIGESRLGFLPLEIALPEHLFPNLRITVVVDNRLTFQTLPVGRLEDGKQHIKHDFANDTGIMREVSLLTVPKERIEDLQISTFVEDDPRRVRIDLVGADCAEVSVLDANGACVAKKTAAQGSVELTVDAPNLWEPGNPYLYTALIETETDRYRQTFGIRQVKVTDSQFFLNGKPLRLKGFGMHEDHPILGKGNNTAFNVRDFELLRWIGANCFRTSHYPYSDEMMELADRYGILVIDEVPAVGMNWWEDSFAPDRINEQTAEIHKEALQRLWERDKNHPCVIMYSVGNEAATEEKNARSYFEPIIQFTKQLTGLPVTFAEFTKCEDTTIGDLVDVIALNRYYGWYYDHGDLSVIHGQMAEELKRWHEKFNKPVLIAEYGADTVEGLHSLPPESFSEEFQVRYLEEMGKAFDECPYCIGDLVWNFADFRTKQGINRVRGNRKGVFTRDRRPKMAAHFLKKRWSE